MSKKQMGFTLIEIVMVLVLLGILSAVAVPKYFDLRDKAEEKAMAAVAAEAQAQINGVFAQKILDNSNSCTAALNEALKVVGTAKVPATGTKPEVAAVPSTLTITNDAYTVEWKSKDLTKGVGIINITPKNNTGNAKEFSIGLPICK